MIELAAKAGYEQVTVRALTRTAGVSSRTFYSQFLNREECFASTIERVGHEMLCRAAATWAAQADWASPVKASIASLFDDLAEQPEAARVLLIESLSAGRPARTRARRLTAEFERLLVRQFTDSPFTNSPPRRLVTGIAAGIVRVATMTTLTGRTGELAGMSAQIGDWAVAIYGQDALDPSAAAGRGPGGRVRRGPSPLPAAMSWITGYGDEARILATVSRLAAEKGFGALSVSKIRREAGVSRRAFDASFASPTECFLAAVESLARAAVRNAGAWTADSHANGDRTYMRTLALCVIAARNQSLARLVLVEILAPGRDGLLRREHLISAAVERMIDAGPEDPDLRTVRLEASVAAAWRIAEADVLADNGPQIPQTARLLWRLFTQTDELLTC
jgi:AcrR family transcriptional regulator